MVKQLKISKKVIIPEDVKQLMVERLNAIKLFSGHYTSFTSAYNQIIAIDGKLLAHLLKQYK